MYLNVYLLVSEHEETKILWTSTISIYSKVEVGAHHYGLCIQTFSHNSKT